MKKAIIILTQPIEANTSSMIRSRNIIKEIPSYGYKTICYSPYSDNVNELEFILPNVEIRRYGKVNYVANFKESLERKVSLKYKILKFMYKLYKKVDIFGASIQYLKYTHLILDEVKNEKPDILLTFSDPMTSHIIGRKCRKYANKYVQQWGDPLATDTISKIGLPVWLRKIIEKTLIKKADRVCYVSPFTCDEQKKLYGKYANKMIFLPTPSIEYQNIKKEKHDKLKIGYFGSYNLIARDIRPLYEAVSKNKNIELFLIGNSDLNLKTKENITVIDRISQTELDKYFYEMDILVCVLNSKGNQIPGKMYHYAGSYKEILVIKDGEFGNEIEKFFMKYNHYSFVDNDKNKISLILNNYVEKGIPEREPVLEFSANRIAKCLIQNL